MTTMREVFVLERTLHARDPCSLVAPFFLALNISIPFVVDMDCHKFLI